MRPAAAVTLAIALTLGACATATEKGEEISIEHAANQFLVARVMADDYCDKQGRAAQHLMTGPRQPSFLAFQASVSVFRCVPRKAAAK